MSGSPEVLWPCSKTASFIFNKITCCIQNKTIISGCLAQGPASCQDALQGRHTIFPSSFPPCRGGEERLCDKHKEQLRGRFSRLSIKNVERSDTQTTEGVFLVCLICSSCLCILQDSASLSGPL